MTAPARNLLPLLAATALALVAQTTSTAPARLPVPEMAKRTESLAVIQKLFKDELASKKPQDRVAVAKRLLKEALDTHDDMVARYVLLDQSAALAALGGDPDTVCTALGALDAGYIIDLLPLRGDLLARCLFNLSGPAIEREVALAFETMDRAVTADNFPLAKRMADLAEEAAGKKQSVAYSASIQQRLRDFHAVADESLRAADAAKTLQSTDDPAAHFTLGHFQALGQGNFADGLPHLAKGNDTALAALAAADLANPTSTDAQVKLGDQWWALAESQTNYPRTQAAARAQYWYRQAKATITGITLTKINARLTEGQPAPALPAEAHGADLLTLIDVDKDAVAGAWKRAEGGLLVTPDKYTRLQLPVRPPEEYDLTIRFTRTDVVKANAGTVAIMLVYKDKAFDLSLNDTGSTARFEAINKNAVKDNPTIVPLKLENNQPYTVTIAVRKTGLRATLDDKLLTEFKTDYKDLSTYSNWKLKDISLLGVGANAAAVRFEKIELLPITGQPRLMRPSP